MTLMMKAFIFSAVFMSVELSFAGDTDARKYQTAQIFVNNHKFGDTNGCTTELRSEGHITCGHPGHVSEVIWIFLRSSQEGDFYKITRKYPSDSDTPKTDTKEEVYAGKRLILWHDEFQNIILQPKPKAEPAGADQPATVPAQKVK